MKSKYLMIGAAVCAALFLFSGIMLCRQYADEKQSTEAFEQVAALVETESAPADTPQETEPLSELAAFEKYRAVQEQNSDFVGWLSIPGTNIDYPVMQTVNEPNFYLKRGFDKQYSDYGVPYVQENCDLALSDNCVIYGHHMNNGTMFADLCKYESEGFYQEHKTIHFDTLSGFGEYNNGATANSMLAAEDPGPYRQRYYMSLDDAIGVCKNYTVIGIYTGARFAFGAYQLNADTILVPKASVPNAQNYETRANSLLNTFVLKNGSAKEFEKYMEQQNLAGQFLYFDQDFSSMQESLDALETNAMRLMMVGIGVFLLTSALFLFLNFRRMNLTIRGVRLLGRSSKAVFREIIMALIPLETLAVLFGTCAAIALFDVVTRNLLSSALTLRPEAMAVSAVTAFVFLMVSTMISTAIFANRKLMKAK